MAHAVLALRFAICEALAEAGATVILTDLNAERAETSAQYNASKAAVHQLTNSLTAEWPDRGVRVNAVAPTYIEIVMNKYVYEDVELMKHWIGGAPQARME